MAKRTFAHWGLWLALSIATAVVLYTLPARAADLGGNCCADLEERIAELEATTARKGNRKVSVTVSGQISQGVVWYDVDDLNDWSAGSDSTTPSYLQIAGSANITAHTKAVFVMQIAVGNYELGLAPFSYGHLNDGEKNGIDTYKVYVGIKGPAGAIYLGKMSMANDGVMKASQTNANYANRMLSFAPLIDDNQGVGSALGVVTGGQGQIASGVRYDTPVWNGFQISASIAPTNADSSGSTDGTLYAVALKYVGDCGSATLKCTGAVGYANGIVVDDTVPVIGNINIALGDVKTLSASGEVWHIPSGLFVGAAAYQSDLGDFGGPEIKGYALRGGVQKQWWAFGDTTAFVSYSKWDMGSDPSMIALGLVQAIDAAAMTLNLSLSQTKDLFADDLTVVKAGATINF